MIVAVFDPSTRAVDGHYALRRLDEANSIRLRPALIDKADGAQVRSRTRAGIATLSGSAIAIITAGCSAGGRIASARRRRPDRPLSELDTARIDAVGSVLTPGRSAVVAEIDEDWTAPVDDAVEALGGRVFRRTLAYDTETQAQRSIDALKKDHALLRAELAVASPECRRRLQTRIAAAEARLARKLSESKAHREAIRRQADARLAALRAKAAQATGDSKAKQLERVVGVERAYGEWLDRMDDRADRSSSGR